MLTADLVDARVKDGEVLLRKLDARSLGEAHDLAELLLDAARSHVGRRREELEVVWDELLQGARKPKMAAAVRKLVDDACVFEAEERVAAVDLRRALFARASEVRRLSSAEEPWDRRVVVDEVAATFGIDGATLERALFADLRGEHLLREVAPLTAAGVVEAYQDGRAQAVLLRAVRVTCDVEAASPGLLRAFFAKLKFHKLLFTAERRSSTAFRLVIDGPYSMFDAVTRYGLRLALLLPALRALDVWTLEAEVRWGHAREARTFRLRGENPGAAPAGDDAVHLSDEVRTLLADLRSARTPFVARPAASFLDVPGLGVCVPDLVLEAPGLPPVYVEVMGFWSRDAVFRRIELAERGLGERVVFAVSNRLRVSEELLAESPAASLYVYKGKPSARALLERVMRVAEATRST